MFSKRCGGQSRPRRRLCFSTRVRSNRKDDTMLRRVDFMSIVLLAVAMTLPGGCAPKTPGEKSVQSYMDTRETLAESRQQVAMTQASLTGLRASPPHVLKDAFRRY